MDIIRDGIIKTRKAHECHGCFKTIPKNSISYSQTNISDGIHNLYICNECLSWCKSRKCNDCIKYEHAFPGYVKECRMENERKV